MQLLKTSLVFYVSFFLTIQVYAQGFRKASWGISIEEVKKIETSLLIKNDSNKVFSSITYSDLVGNYPSLVTYTFIYDSLCRGQFHFTNSDNNYFSQYITIKTLITEKYGYPDIDTDGWSNTLYKNNPEYYETALMMNHCKFWAKWTVGQTDIKMELRYNSIVDRPLITIDYWSNVLNEKEYEYYEQLQREIDKEKEVKSKSDDF